MITATGTVVSPGGDNAPSLYDIGWNLSRIPRYVGGTPEPWSVLQHSYACAQYARETGGAPRVQLHALLHDAHEAVTGDIPYPWKSPDMSAFQEELDRRIFASLFIAGPTPDEAALVKKADEAILFAESKLVGGPNTFHVISSHLKQFVPEMVAMNAVHYGGVWAHMPTKYQAERFESSVRLLIGLAR